MDPSPRPPPNHDPDCSAAPRQIRRCPARREAGEHCVRCGHDRVGNPGGTFQVWQAGGCPLAVGDERAARMVHGQLEGVGRGRCPRAARCRPRPHVQATGWHSPPDSRQCEAHQRSGHAPQPARGGQ
eukprot:scaffold11827_cov107-Isochrysis_galbana.AAC.6